MNLMKSTCSLVATCAVAIIPLGASAQNAGIVPPTGLPAFLPMSTNESVVREWIVTNRPCYVNVWAEVTNIDDQAVYQAGNADPPQSFGTYKDYASYVIGWADWSVNWIRTNGVNPNSSINLFIHLNYADKVTDYFDALVIRGTNVATIGTFTAAIATNILPKYEMVLVPVPGLQRLDISVDSDPPFTYSSASTSNTFLPYTRQIYSENMLNLYSWYCLGTNRARITVTANGIMQTYTQLGAPILPGTMAPVDAENWKVFSAPGSDAEILGTTDCITWQKVADLKWWNTNPGSATIKIPITTSHRYYQARSY